MISPARLLALLLLSTVAVSGVEPATAKNEPLPPVLEIIEQALDRVAALRRREFEKHYRLQHVNVRKYAVRQQRIDFESPQDLLQRLLDLRDRIHFAGNRIRSDQDITDGV